MLRIIIIVVVDVAVVVVIIITPMYNTQHSYGNGANI